MTRALDAVVAKLATLSEAQRLQVAEEVQNSVRPFFPNDEMNFPAQMIIVTARKQA